MEQVVAALSRCWHLVPRRRWWLLIVADALVAALVLSAMAHGDHPRPWGLALLSMWAHGEMIAMLVIVNLVVVSVSLAGAQAALQAVRRSLGSDVDLVLYRGPWCFSRPRRWYFTAFETTGVSAPRKAILTLGTDIKEVVDRPAPQHE